MSKGIFFLNFYFKCIFVLVDLCISWKWFKTCKCTPIILIWTCISLLFQPFLLSVTRPSFHFTHYDLLHLEKRTLAAFYYLTKVESTDAKEMWRIYLYLMSNTCMCHLVVINIHRKLFKQSGQLLYTSTYKPNSLCILTGISYGKLNNSLCSLHFVS